MKSFLTSCLLLAASFVFAQSNLSSSLTACYALNGNGTEPINNLTATLSAVTATVDRFNNPNSAYYFSGSSSSYIKLPNNSLIKPNTISFSAWIKTNSLASQYIAFTQNTCGSFFEGYAFAVHNPGNGTRFHLVKSSTGCSTSSQVVLNSNQLVATQTWYHVGFYAGPDSLKIYVNGVLNASLANSNPISYSVTGQVYLGGTNGNNNLSFGGTIDNVRFYNRKLTNAEFNLLYTQDPSCVGPAPPVASFSVSPTTICAGSSFSLTDLSSNSPNAWNWQVAGTNTASASTNNPILNIPSPGNYTVSLVSTNSVGVSNTATQVITILPNPTLTISSPSTLCLGHTATLTASGASSYSWSTNQSGSSIVIGPMTVSSSYSVIGSYTSGCSSTALQSVSVNTIVPSISISGGATICQGSSTTLTATGSAISYTWANISVGSILTVTPSGSAVYTVTGTGSNGCTSSTTQAVTVNSLPIISVNSNNTSICLGNAATLAASGANTYTWSGGVVNNTPFYPNATASYTVVGTSTNNCQNTATQLITVFPNPTITISSPGSFCVGQTATLTANGASTYSWSNGQNGSSIIIGPNNVSASYSVIGTSSNGCVSTALQSVTLNTVLPSISVSGSGTICEGSPTTLLASGSAITFSWSTGAMGNLITVTPLASTVYTVIGTGVNGCTISATQLVFVNTAPSVLINSNNTSVCIGDVVVLNASGANTYTWSGGVVNNTPFFPSTSSTYSVVGTGTNSCKNTASIQILVNPLPVLTHSILTTLPVCAGEPITLAAGGANIYAWSNGGTLPTNIVTATTTSNFTVTGTDANGCKSSYVFMISVEPCTSIKENNSNAFISIYPNPNHGQFLIQGLNNEYKNLKVINLIGELIQQKDLNHQSNEVLINIENQPKGIYFVVLSNDTIHEVFKFIVE
jgi:hypothetical protein